MLEHQLILLSISHTITLKAVWPYAGTPAYPSSQKSWLKKSICFVFVLERYTIYTVQDKDLRSLDPYQPGDTKQQLNY